MGELQTNVSYGDQHVQLPLIVVAGNGPNLMGRNRLKHIQLNWHSHSQKRSLYSLNTLLSTCCPFQHDSITQSYSARTLLQAKTNIPFALKDVVGQELDRLEQQLRSHQESRFK